MGRALIGVRVTVHKTLRSRGRDSGIVPVLSGGFEGRQRVRADYVDRAQNVPRLGRNYGIVPITVIVHKNRELRSLSRPLAGRQHRPSTKVWASTSFAITPTWMVGSSPAMTMGREAGHSRHPVVVRPIICPTGNPCIPRMRQLPVVPVCRGLITCAVGQITFTFSRIPAR